MKNLVNRDLFLTEKNKNKKDTAKYLCDEKDLSKNIKHRTGAEYGKKPTAKQQEKIDATKHFIAKLPDGTKVYYVDFELSRDVDHFGDLVEGGNECAYPNFVPKGEIWIDDAFRPTGGTSDKKLKARTNQIMVHEAIERKEMQEDPNREYFKETAKTRMNATGEEGAHVDANEIERKVRDGKMTPEEAIEKFYGKEKNKNED